MLGRGFPRAVKAAMRDFLKPEPDGSIEEQLCQPKANPVLPDSFTQIKIIFVIGFRIGPPKMHRRSRIRLHKIHRRFRIGPPKRHKQFRIGPPQDSLNLLPPELYRQGFPLTIAIMTEKQENNLFEIECIRIRTRHGICGQI